MNIFPKAAHRPSRRFPDAPRKVLQPEVKECPYCGHKLKSTGNLYINREVQTMNGPLNVRAYGWHCVSDDCPSPHIRYRARRELWRISLPKCGYGLDVIAHIGWQRDKIFRQFGEIQLDLQSRGIQISQRHVGRLYRQYLSLLGGMTDLRLNELKKVNQSHGGIVLALDGLQPDKDGTILYVLYEAISETTIAAAWIDKRDTEHLTNWLKPYSKLDLTVLATLSLGYDAEIATLKSLWKNSPHQMCLTHFLGDCGKPIKEADKKLKTALRQGMGQLPPVPGDKNSALAGPAAATPVLSEPTTVHHTLNTPHPISDNNVATHDNTYNNHHTNPVLPTQESQEPDSLGKPAKQQTNNTNLPSAMPSEPSNTRQTQSQPTAMPPASPNTRQTLEKAAFGDHEISRGLPTSTKTLQKADDGTLNYSQLPSECLDTKFSCQESTESQAPIPCANVDSQNDGQSPKTCANVESQITNLSFKNQATSLKSDLVSSLNTTDLIAQGKTTSNLSKSSLSRDNRRMQPSIEGNLRTSTLTVSCPGGQKNEIEPKSALSVSGPSLDQTHAQSIFSSYDTTSTPISTQDTNSTPISTQDTNSTPISTQDTTSTPVSNQNTTSTPVSNQNTASTTNQTPPVAEQDIDQKQLRMREIEHLFRKSAQ